MPISEDNEKLDALRSPHNFREHCVKVNKIDKFKETDRDISNWFITNDIYTSTKDLISKQLMFDVDGDDSLIVNSPEFVSIAEEHMQEIRPLQYKLGKAEKEEINNPNIYKALTVAYSKSQAIGELANDICKIWNSGKVGKDNMDLIRILCFESNAYIDYAKTLWLPSRPPEIHEKLKEISKQKVPYFFKYAKGKKNNQIQPINKSVVNLLSKIIPNYRIVFEDVAGEFVYKMLMHNTNYQLTDDDQRIIDLYKKENKDKTKLIKEQMKNQGNMKKKGIELQVYKEMRKKFLKLGTADHVTDVLVKYLYEEQNDKHKQTLWFCFGWEITLPTLENVKDFYEVHMFNDGYISVFNIERKKYIKPHIDEYFRYGLRTIENTSRTVYMHRIVGLAWIGGWDIDKEIDYIDTNKLNNLIGNLEWVTSKENTQRAIANDLGVGRPRVFKVKKQKLTLLQISQSSSKDRNGLTYEQVESIFTMIERGYSETLIAKKFGVSQPCISQILSGKRWKAHPASKFYIEKLKAAQ